MEKLKKEFTQAIVGYAKKTMLYLALFGLLLGACHKDDELDSTPDTTNEPGKEITDEKKIEMLFPSKMANIRERSFLHF
jgi:hypothetical protein